MCPTLKALMELEWRLFSITQTDDTENEYDDEAWDKAFKKAKALGGKDLLLIGQEGGTK